MKTIVLSILSSFLIATAAAHPAEAASRKSKPVVMHSDRSRDAFATIGPSAATLRSDPYAALEIERVRNGALSPPAGR
jgi:hypothetical protein